MVGLGCHCPVAGLGGGVWKLVVGPGCRDCGHIGLGDCGWRLAVVLGCCVYGPVGSLSSEVRGLAVGLSYAWVCKPAVRLSCVVDGSAVGLGCSGCSLWAEQLL